MDINEARKRTESYIDDHRDDIFGLLRRLIAIKSFTTIEGEAQRLIEAELQKLGLATRRIVGNREALRAHPEYNCYEMPYMQALEERPNIVGNAPGSGGGRSLVLFAHIDTVPIFAPEKWTHDPFAGGIENGRLYGRGAADDKAGVVQNLMALTALRGARIPLRGDLTFASTIEEEVGGVPGIMACILDGVQGDGAFYGHPIDTGMRQLNIANLGILTFDVHVPGFPTSPLFYVMDREEGNAIEWAAEIVLALRQLGVERRKRVSCDIYDRLYGNATCICPSVARIKGSGYYLATPEACVVTATAQYPPGEREEDVKQEISAAVERVAQGDPWLRRNPPRIVWGDIRFTPSQVPETDDIVTLSKRAIESYTGSAPIVSGIPTGSDIRFFNNYTKTPAISFGATGANFHGADEWLDMEEYLSTIKATAAFIMSWCGVG
ncbi:MAG: M20/M25/M40 family metallo-hydrolase [Candidatus Tectomicrobia bacterium]|nr:M20/M25/M40 family metallo-hydrolase [Candidatus Tectomicrobia bacterium]